MRQGIYAGRVTMDQLRHAVQAPELVQIPPQCRRLERGWVFPGAGDADEAAHLASHIGKSLVTSMARIAGTSACGCAQVYRASTS